jgi:hypothetical protein
MPIHMGKPRVLGVLANCVRTPCLAVWIAGHVQSIYRVAIGPGLMNWKALGSCSPPPSPHPPRVFTQE